MRRPLRCVLSICSLLSLASTFACQSAAEAPGKPEAQAVAVSGDVCASTATTSPAVLVVDGNPAHNGTAEITAITNALAELGYASTTVNQPSSVFVGDTAPGIKPSDVAAYDVIVYSLKGYPWGSAESRDTLKGAVAAGKSVFIIGDDASFGISDLAELTHLVNPVGYNNNGEYAPTITNVTLLNAAGTPTDTVPYRFDIDYVTAYATTDTIWATVRDGQPAVVSYVASSGARVLTSLLNIHTAEGTVADEAGIAVLRSFFRDGMSHLAAQAPCATVCPPSTPRVYQGVCVAACPTGTDEVAGVCVAPTADAGAGGSTADAGAGGAGGSAADAGAGGAGGLTPDAGAGGGVVPPPACLDGEKLCNGACIANDLCCPSGAVLNLIETRSCTGSLCNYTNGCFRGADLSNIVIDSPFVIFTNADFTNANLAGASISTTSNLGFSGAKFTGAVLTGASLSATNMSFTNANFDGAVATDAIFTASNDMDFINTEATGAIMNRLSLSAGDDLTFTNAVFVNANLRRLAASGARIQMTTSDFGGSDLTLANFAATESIGISLTNFCDAVTANLTFTAPTAVAPIACVP